jgi:hypothetical protein
MRGSPCLLRVLSVALFVLALAGCAPLRLQPVAPLSASGASRLAGRVRPGDTNVTNLVATGDVTVGGDLTVSGECTGCGGGVGYKTYVATLTQADGNAPVAVVFENTLGGTVVWTRFAAGVYFGTLTGAFPPGKTFIETAWQSNLARAIDIEQYYQSANFVKIETIQDGDYSDSVLQGASVIIRVYP